MGPSPRRPPPTPRSAPKAEVPDDNADNTTQVWNTAVANLPAFLVSLDQNDSLLSSVPGLLTLWTRGYEIDGKGRKVVESDKHMLWLLNNPDTEYSFESPSPVGTHRIADSAEARITALALGIVPPPGTSATDLPAAQEKCKARQKELREMFSTNPTRLAEIDRLGVNEIKNRISNTTYANELAKNNGMSARSTVRALVAMKANKISDKARLRHLDSFDDCVKEGLHHPTVEAFNDFVDKLALLNPLLKKPKDDDELAELYVRVTRDAVGDIRQVEMNVKLDQLDNATFASAKLRREAILQFTNLPIYQF